MAANTPQDPDGTPHISTSEQHPALTTDGPDAHVDLTEYAAAAPANVTVPVEGDPDMTEVAPNMAERLLHAIDDDNQPGAPHTASSLPQAAFPTIDKTSKDTSYPPATNKDNNSYAPADVFEDTEAARGSATSATAHSTLPNDPVQVHHEVGATERPADDIPMPDEDEEAELDEDFDADAFIRGSLLSMEGLNDQSRHTTATTNARMTLNASDAWMQDFQHEEDEDADKEAELKYNKAKREYERKRRAGTLTEEEDITWLRIKKAEESRLKIKFATMQAEMEADQEEMNEDTITTNDLFYEDEPYVPATSAANKRPRQDSGYHVIDGDDEDEEEPAPKKSKSNKKRGAANSSAKRANKAKESKASKAKAGPKVKKVTKKQKQQMRSAGMFTNLEGLTNGNIWRDIENNKGGTHEPTFTSTKKPQALKELIASIPLEHRDEGKMDANAVFAAARKFTPATSCKPDGEGGWKVNGMVSSLSSYQMLGTSFLRHQETQEVEEPRGGIVADAMGLGKTVMMIANIVNGKNLARGKGPTLIVAPSSLVHQWHSELMKHADVDKRVLGRVTRYCAGHRGGEMPLEDYFKSYQLIITTYADVSSSYPKSDVPLGMDDPAEKAEWWNKYYEENKGAFHRIKFHRVILDEAHAIKNHKSMTSIACRALDATHRWAISGTPSQNSLSEFYPYFKFLRMPGTGDFKAFKNNYCTEDDPSGSQRLAAMLRKVMLRRTHGDMLMGSKLLNLPDTDNRDHVCILSDIERGIYEVVHGRFVSRINVLAKQGELKKQYSNVLVMLLRLRQLVAHPLLIQDTIKDLLEPEDFVALEKVINAPTNLSSSQESMIQHLRRMLRSPKDLATLDAAKDLAGAAGPVDSIEVEDDEKPDSDGKPNDSASFWKADSGTETEVPIKQEAEEEMYMPFPKRSAPTEPREVIDLNDDLDDIVENDKAATKLPKTPCIKAIDLTDDQPNAAPAYNGQPELVDVDTKKAAKRAKFDDSNVGGAFGLRDSYSDWVSDMKAQAALEGEDPANECVMCHKPPKKPVQTSCDHTYCYDCLRDLADACKDRGELMTKCISCEEYCSMLRKNTSSNMFTKNSAAALDGEDRKKKKPDIKTVIDTWVDEDGMMLPSAKTLAFKAQIMNWIEQDPDVKIIVYSQFLTMIRIFAKICSLEKWPCLQYTGTQSIDRRDRVLSEFHSDPTQRILLASLRSGGTGLNLTCASRVLMVDLWWNSSVEQQAFARTYRRGQDKETAMTRLIAANTVDEQLVTMQRRKETEINGVMVSSGLKRKLTLTELMGLFGKVGEDEQGRSFILVEEEKGKRRAERFGEEDEGDGGFGHHRGGGSVRRGRGGRRA